MKKLIFIVLLIISSSKVFAQQSATPLEQTLLQKLNVEVGNNIQCSVSLITAQQESDKLKARIKELETKAEKPK